MFKLILFFVSVCAARGGFFDLTDVDDPFALLWNLRKSASVYFLFFYLKIIKLI